MSARLIIGFIFMTLAAAAASAQNCCAPAVPQQGIMGETIALPHVLDIAMHYEYLRAEDMYTGSDCACDLSGTIATWKRATLTLAYGVSSRIGVTAVVPYIWKSKTHYLPAIDAPVKNTTDGLGDVSLVGQFSVIPRNFVTYRELSLGLGVKFPTGATDKRTYGFLLPEELQPGTGSWDVLSSISFYQGWELVDIYASTSYQLTSEYEGFEFGNQLSYLLSANLHIVERLDVSLAFSGTVRGEDRQDGESLESTGRHQLWIVPGLQAQIIPRWLRLQLYFEAPVYQHFNGTQLGSEYNLRLTAASSIPLFHGEK